MPKHRLLAGDVAVPSAAMLNTSKISSCAVPRRIMFWRFQRDVSGFKCGMVIRRNPIFGAGGLEPTDHAASDILHTI
eukprot:4253455-Pyramimonas_sp.AAC.1